jgi:hypothetical protein
MTRRIPALMILGIGLLFGILGYGFFYEQFFGINVVLFLSAVLIVILALSVMNRTQLSIRKLWLIVPILFFAAMIAFRANLDLLFFDGVMMLGLLMLFSFYLTRTQVIDTAATPELIGAGIEGGVGMVFGTFPTLWALKDWLKKGNWRTFSGMKSIIRGVTLAIPIVIIFGVLLSSADMVFAERIDSIFGFLLPDNIDSLIETVFVVGVFTWLSTGLIWTSLFPLTSRMTKPITDETTNEATNASLDEKPKKQSPTFFSLNLTESSIVLTSVVVLFATFVLIQFTYLFGGRTMIGDFTFAEYARRGFFELVAVSVLIQGLILILDNATIRRSQVQNSVFRMLSITLIVETFIILASAWRRMSLYEIEYGFTHLRLYTHIFMIWLGILLGFTILDLLRVKKNIFTLGLLLVAIGYLGTLNIINVDNYIAARNIERFNNGHDLDMCYFRELSQDALPAISAFYEETTDAAALYNLREILREWHRQESERFADYTAWIEYNYSHQRTHEYLQELRRIPSNVSEWQSCYIDVEQ